MLRLFTLITSILLSISLSAQLKDETDSLSGTIVLEKAQSLSNKGGSGMGVAEYIREGRKAPYRYADSRSNRQSTVGLYALLSKRYDKRYDDVSEFKLKATLGDAEINLYSDSKSLTSDMLLAMVRMRKVGGTATFYSIKSRRTVGSISLPSFSYVAYEGAGTDADLTGNTQE